MKAISMRLGVTIIACLAIAACKITPGDDPAGRAASLRDIQPTTKPKDPTTKPAAQATSVVLRRMDFPLEASLDPSWTMVNTDTLAPAMVEQWRANGLRVGLLRKSHIKTFAAVLPSPLNAEQQLLVATGSPLTLAVSAPINQKRDIELTVRGAATIERLPRGLPQFLVDLEQAPHGVMMIELTPHHYAAQMTLLPRSPLEAQYDGRIFKELRLHAEVSADQVLVVALDPPPKPVEETVAPPPAEETPEPTPPAEENSGERPINVLRKPLDFSASQPATRPSLQTRLGDLLLTASRRNQPVQSLLIFGAAEESARKKP